MPSFLWAFSKDKLLIRKPTKLMELRAFNHLCFRVSEDLWYKCVRSSWRCLEEEQWSYSTTCALETIIHTSDLQCVRVCVIFKIFLWNTEGKQNLNGSTFCGPPCTLNPNSLANLLCLVLWREEYASHSLPVSPFAHQILGKPPSEIKLTFLYYTYFRKPLKMSPKQQSTRQVTK